MNPPATGHGADGENRYHGSDYHTNGNTIRHETFLAGSRFPTKRQGNQNPLPARSWLTLALTEGSIFTRPGQWRV
jgi:hypothetical protein